MTMATKMTGLDVNQIVPVHYQVTLAQVETLQVQVFA